MLSKYTLYVVPVELSLLFFKLKETNVILSNGIQQLLLLLKQTHQMMAEGESSSQWRRPYSFHFYRKTKMGLMADSSVILKVS